MQRDPWIYYVLISFLFVNDYYHEHKYTNACIINIFISAIKRLIGIIRYAAKAITVDKLKP